MSNQAVTLSSVGTSNPVHLNWRGGKPTTAVVSLGSTTMTVDFTIQYTMQDTMLSTNAAGTAATNTAWISVSSALGSSVISHWSSALADTALLYPFAGPIAGLRLASSAISASATITMRVIQGESWALLMAALGGNLLYHILNGAIQWTSLIA